MSKILKFSTPLIVLLLLSGCVQKTKISMKVPGEINVKGVHKIAIVDFSTVKSNNELGIYKANDDLLKLAKDEIINIFYKEPFYSFSDLEIESNIKEKDIKASIKDRFDGLLYGKLWWQETPEYHNIIPSKANLETYKIVHYTCGRTKKGKPIICSAHITTKTQDKAYNKPYRVKNLTLMMSINFYRLSPNGKLDKVTEVFEIAKGKFQIENGKYTHLVSLIGEKEKLDRLKMLTKKEDKGFFANMIDKLKLKKVSKKVNADVKTINNINTIPSKYTINKIVLAKIIKKFQQMIAPTKKEFELEIKKGDNKVEKMFDYSAFNAISSYIVEQKLALGNKKFYDGFYNAEFISTERKLLVYLDKQKFEKDNVKNKKKSIYKPISNDKLNELAIEKLKDNTDDIYNYALATEAIGDYEKSLEIYRFLFNNIDSKNQDYANGIGRALLALDMADKVNEEKLNKIKAQRSNSL